MPTIPFYLLSAFSSSENGGNPAAVVILPPNSHLLKDDSKLIAIAKNLNQPIATFISRDVHVQDGTWDVRWLTPTGIEVMLCGHGTLAGAQVLFALEPDRQKVTLRTQKGRLVAATRVIGNKVAIEIPDADIQECTPEETKKIADILRTACKKEDLEVLNVVHGVGAYSEYLQIDIGRDEDLKSLVIDPNIIVHILIFTRAQS